jgi:adenine-specific DNA-methyltransferase
MMDLLEVQLLHFAPSKDGWTVKKKKYFDETDPDTGVYLNLLLEQGSLKVAKNEMVSLGFEREEFSTPKPLVLVKQLLRTICNPNDIILDSFAGSGTTAHTVLSLNKEDNGNRKFILIECQDADTITAERVRRVINGVPDASNDKLREGLGGSFTYCTLGEPIELEAMLTGEKLPTYAALATNLLFTAAGISIEDDTLDQKNDDGLFYSDNKNDYYLIYKPDLEFLRSNEAILNLDQARRIRDSSQDNGRKAIAYAAGNYIGQRELTKMGIAFCQLPYVIHER